MFIFIVALVFFIASYVRTKDLVEGIMSAFVSIIYGIGISLAVFAFSKPTNLDDHNIAVEKKFL